MDMPTRFVPSYFGGFKNRMKDYRLSGAGGRFVNVGTLPFFISEDHLIGTPDFQKNKNMGYVDFWDPETTRLMSEGIRTEYRFVLEQVIRINLTETVKKISETAYDSEVLMRTRDGLEFLFPLKELFDFSPEGHSEYRLRIIASRYQLPKRVIISQIPIVTKRMEFNVQGQLVSQY
jgi:hypothetical protein